MNRLRTVFGRLQWKLTLSYTLVTSAVVIVLLLAVMLVAWTLVFRSDVLGSALSGLMNPLAEELAPLLSQEPLPEEAVAAWLASRYQDGRLVMGGDGLTTNFGDVSLAMVVDRRGELVAAAPGQGSSPAALPAGARTAMAAALADQPVVARSVRDETDGALYVANPVRGESGNVLGAFFVQVALPQTQEALVRSVLNGLLPAMIPIVLSAGFVGAIFGFVAARGLTRRLRALAATADAWSQGDFTAFVQDRSADEVGQLGQQLNRMAEQLQNLLQTREELAAVDERNRLARELHDAVKQQLFAATMQIGAAQARLESDPKGAGQHLADAAELANQAQRELASLIQELRPPALAGRGLAEALEVYAEDWSRQSGVAVQVRVAGARTLPLGVEQALFRVAQEALANTGRHSGATQALVSLVWQDSVVTLEVRDDGRGFVPASTASGYGLESMRQRVASLGGELRVASKPGAGTTVAASVPLTQEKQP